MATIRTRQRSDGSVAFLAEIRIKRGGEFVHRESRTFDRRAQADAIRSFIKMASRTNPAEIQNCANCALVPGNESGPWVPCQIFPGKVVNANGWCAVWAPKA